MVKRNTASHQIWSDLPVKTLNPKIVQQIMQGDDMMLSRLVLKAGAQVSRHAHPNEQFTCILEGALEFRMGEDLEHSATVRAGEVLHIPANVPHSAFALEDTVDLDIFTPPRKDWLQPGGEDYFRKR
ncbi:cupin domain-containing protein [Paraburkholderia flava]|uniref:cupin domain-containing protein n=1 Tax=Paraburkholderia flava TaxID=2547393 RepID=UPI00105E1E61|nr:cupin domain-containing protein [Paraburkholderia flava]